MQTTGKKLHIRRGEWKGAGKLVESQLRANKLQTSTYQEVFKVLAISELLEKKCY